MSVDEVREKTGGEVLKAEVHSFSMALILPWGT